MKFDGGLILTAGTLNPQLPRKAIPSVEISVWLKSGQAPEPFAIEHVASGQLGRVQTLFNGSFNLGVTAGSFALGGVADAFGHRAAFVCAGVTALVATAIFAATTGDARSAAMQRSSLDTDASASG